MWRATRGTNSRQTETANTKTLGHAGSENPPVLGQLGMGGGEADERRPEQHLITGTHGSRVEAERSRLFQESRRGTKWPRPSDRCKCRTCLESIYILEMEPTKFSAGLHVGKGKS